MEKKCHLRTMLQAQTQAGELVKFEGLDDSMSVTSMRNVATLKIFSFREGATYCHDSEWTVHQSVFLVSMFPYILES